MDKINFVRTPDDRFANLSDFPFTPNYKTVMGELRMHYVDENPNAEQVVVLLHGEPSWSYLYRKMIPLFSAKGYRVIAPDLIGFGKSDKPTEKSAYSYQNHLDWVRDLLFDQLDLKNIHLFVQDWGGLLGLRLLAEQPERFKSITAGNTALPTGNIPMNEAFMNWLKYSQEVPVFPVGRIVQGGTATDLAEPVIAAYDAPFPDETYKIGARVFPALVPVSPDNPASLPNKNAWKVLSTLEIPFLTLFGDSDPIMKGVEKIFHAKIPGTKGQPHAIIQNAGHFLQEDQGETIAEKMLEWWSTLD